MNNLTERNMVSRVEEEDSINIKEIINKLLNKWPWFVISIFVCLLIAFIYGKYTAPTYQIRAKLIVNDDEKGGNLGKQASSLMDLGGLMGSKNSVDNEAEILKTRFLMEQVVRDMQLNVVYSKKTEFFIRELYRSPINLVFIKSVDTINATDFKVIKVAKTKLKITSRDFEKTVAFGEKFNVPGVGIIQLVENSGLKMDESEYFIKVSSIDTRVASLMKQLSVTVSNKQVSIIDLGLSYPVPAKGEDILNTLINRYTQSNLSDKNAVADSTYRFIKERLNVIASELGDVENNVESFKQRNQLADMSEQGKLLVQNTGEFSTDLAKAETQVSVLNDLEKYLTDDSNVKRVFPSALIPTDMVFSNLMSQYNALLIEREKQLLSVTEESPFIQNIDTQIKGLKSDILSNVRSSKNSAILTRNRLKSQLLKAEGKISGVPEVEKNYLKLARNQQIKQELYIFLMQKAEETNISKTANISIAKTIDPPKSELLPIAPKKNIVYTIGLIIGILIPIILIFSQALFNTTVTTKDEIGGFTQVPVIGEINHNESDDNLIVANQGRSAISEQFRALRTNLSFYLKNNNEKVILLTSSMSGEGKSFTAINLGNILALAGKKVLLMEFDLRKPGLSAKLGIDNSVGFSNYTISPEIKVTDIVKPLTINKNMFIISSGPLPPNPAETLLSEHTPGLIEELKAQFDYIIMDAPPIGIITDAQLLSVYADVTLYLVRQKVTQKDQLNIVEELFTSGKMKNLGIVVNDIDTKLYGYGYGYGTYGENKKPNSLTKLKNIFKNS
ncbi:MULTISPECIES: GumC family protein [unclassified Pedobacter]|uniref:GumC family protein n=1 Tax=unclassified Pedobacter TaxID=2628915 RepID=UPI0017AF579E|nr:MULTISPECIES: tyrosine-protein kinase [unclassified Pedobacter]NII84046.1 capsular exopolysaccharide synthesis family protein [Pedobacter sp. SG908]NMN39038.1 capsular exopolysaccharide synthesis family protein [Pedobacter sp. SG918]